MLSDAASATSFGEMSANYALSACLLVENANTNKDEAWYIFHRAVKNRAIQSIPTRRPIPYTPWNASTCSVLSITFKNHNVPSMYYCGDVSRKRTSNDINEALFCNHPSEFTQTKLLVHGHRHDDENCIGRSSGNMTMYLVIASGGTAMVRKSLSE